MGERRVLIVDDDENLRWLLKAQLARDGRFEVVGEAGDGRAAIETAKAVCPDVIFLDLAMPGMDGLEALPILRADHSQAVIVVLSGFTGRVLEDKALASGADIYLEKGVSAASVGDKVTVLLASGARG